MSGITRRDLLRFAGVAAVLAACGSRDAVDERRPTTDPRRLRERDPDAPVPEPREQRSPPTDAEGPPEPEDDAEARADEDDPPAATRLEVICRDAWGAQPATPTAATHAVSGLMLHHSAVRLDDNRDAPERMRLHQRHHQGQGWSDIAYHVGVDIEGNVYSLRDPEVPGETGTDYDPAGWLLVMAEGNYDEQEPTPPQLDAMAAVLAWGASRFDVDPTAISTHRHHVPTTRCPGEALFTEVVEGRMAQRVASLLDGGGVELVSLCGAEGRRRVAAIEAGTA